MSSETRLGLSCSEPFVGYISATQLCKIHFNIIPPSMSRPSEYLLPRGSLCILLVLVLMTLWLVANTERLRRQLAATRQSVLQLTISMCSSRAVVRGICACACRATRAVLGRNVRRWRTWRKRRWRFPLLAPLTRTAAPRCTWPSQWIAPWCSVQVSFSPRREPHDVHQFFKAAETHSTIICSSGVPTLFQTLSFRQVPHIINSLRVDYPMGSIPSPFLAITTPP